MIYLLNYKLYLKAIKAENTIFSSYFIILLIPINLPKTLQNINKNNHIKLFKLTKTSKKYYNKI